MIAKKKFINYIQLFVGGGVSVFAYAPFNITVAVGVSLFILIHAIYSFKEDTSSKYAFFCGFVYGIGFFSSQLYWIFYSLYEVINAGFIISLIAFVGFILFLSLYTGLVTLIYNKLKCKHMLLNLLFVFPSLWVLGEWLRGWVFSGFPWSDISYTQVSTSFFKGIYPLLGSYAVSWLLVGLIAALYMALFGLFVANKSQITQNNRRLAILYLGFIIIGGVLLNGKTYTVVYGKPISVALVQGNIEQGTKWGTNNFLRVYQNLIKKAQADLVIIPETAISTFSEYLPKGYLENLTILAQSKGANLIVGIPKIIDKYNNYVNAALLLTNPRHPYYAKYHLVPYGEYIPAKWLLGSIYNAIALPMVGFSAGMPDQVPLVVANQKLAFNICYENGFNTELANMAKQSTIMANLSDMVWYDNTIAKDEHLQISQARALENQRYFIQDTNTGDTAIINPNGQIQSRLPSFKEMILTDQIYGMVGITPFEKVGNYPIIIWCIIVILMCLLRIFTKKI